MLIAIADVFVAVGVVLQDGLVHAGPPASPLQSRLRLHLPSATMVEALNQEVHRLSLSSVCSS